MTKPVAYPLSWPAGLPRHGGARCKASVQISLNRLVSAVLDSLRLLAVDSGIPVYWIVLSSNVTLDDPRPADPGIAIYFSWDGAIHCIAVDQFDLVEANLRAAYEILERCRGAGNAGGLPILRAMLAGFRVSAPSETAA